MANDSESSFSPSPSDFELSDASEGEETANSASPVVSAVADSTSSTQVVDSSTPSRKRRRRLNDWEKSKRKFLRNSGKAYVTASKKNVSFINNFSINT